MKTNYQDRKSTLIPTADRAFFLGLRGKDITLQLLRDLFVPTNKKKNKFNSYDLIFITKEELESLNHPLRHLNFDKYPKGVEYTLGAFIASTFLFEREAIAKVAPIITHDWDGDVIDGIEKELVFNLIDGSIKIEDYRDYLDRNHWLGLAPAKYFIPSFDLGSLVMLPEVKKLRDELLKTHQTEIDAGNMGVMQALVNQLLQEAKRVLERDKPVGYELFLSDVAKFGNHYKNVSVMRGLLPSSADHTKFNFCKSALVTGIEPDEVHKFADLSVLASVSRAIGTQEGGYFGKMFNAAFQHIILGEPGSDCNTKRFITETLDKSNIRNYHLNYILEKDSKTGKDTLVLLDKSNMNSYIGKTVRMRSPIYCNAKNPCSKCAGEFYYRIGIRNVGLLSSRIASKLLNASLKFFHNTSVKTGTVDFNSNLVEVNIEEVDDGKAPSNK